MEECDIDPGTSAAPTERAKVRRKAERGRYDSETIHQILDEGFIGHVGFVTNGLPMVIPMVYARIGDAVYLHGAVGNHTLRTITDDSIRVDACLTVTLIDALVLSRSAFHHSVNYRSVVIYSSVEEVTEKQEKVTALLAIVDHLVPGRDQDTRPPNDAEIRSTRVAKFSLHDASAKVRTGGPTEDPDDLALGFWAGQIPLLTAVGKPVPDPDLSSEVEVPEYVSGYTRNGWNRL